MIRALADGADRSADRGHAEWALAPLRHRTAVPPPAWSGTSGTAYGIPSLAEHLREAGWLTATEIAAQLGVHPTTAKRFAREGVLRAVRADDEGRILFEPPTGPLPRAHPGKRFRDRRRYPQCASHVRKGGAV